MERSIAALLPELAAEWHPTKNGSLRPEDLTLRSGKRVWWRCSRGHEWSTLAHSRTGPNATGCPYCSGRKACEENCLLTLNPELAAEWHPTKNGKLTPRDVRPGSNRRVWWLCHAGPDHEWATTVANRGLRGTGCPFCTGSRPSAAHSLASARPDIAAGWHPERNGKLTPADVTPKSGKRVVWQCVDVPDHVWEESVEWRVGRRRGCPFCAGLRPAGGKSFGDRFPDLAAEWHPTKNGSLQPHDTRPTWMRRVWWRCSAGHDWEAPIRDRATRGRVCPDCRLASRSLAVKRPDLARQWHPTKNGSLSPTDVTKTSERVVWWKCPKGDDHEWEQRIDYRTSRPNRPCPFCAGKRVSVTNSLATLAPEVAAQWHRARNGALGPADVLAADRRLVWWKCPLGHVWRASVHDRTVRRRGCDRCAAG